MGSAPQDHIARLHTTVSWSDGTPVCVCERTFHTALPMMVPRSGGTSIKPSITIIMGPLCLRLTGKSSPARMRGRGWCDDVRKKRRLREKSEGLRHAIADVPDGPAAGDVEEEL
jgi:hypothetical protein